MLQEYALAVIVNELEYSYWIFPKNVSGKIMSTYYSDWGQFIASAIHTNPSPHFRSIVPKNTLRGITLDISAMTGASNGSECDLSSLDHVL